jgi:hypothetical protein
MNSRSVALAALALAGSALAAAQDARIQDSPKHARFEVKVTNLTRDQRFTPLLVVAHRDSVRLFEVGRPASEGLMALAEEGNTAPLAAALAATPGVSGVSTSTGLLAPGQTAIVEVAGSPHDLISLAAMLIPTNDAFVAVDAVGPVGPAGRTVSATAYDAGSETNDELCASIPGPDFEECGGPGGGGAPSGGEEGFVRVHEGIHGIGDLRANARDWRNPVAKVTIRRIP